ncbi:hypothetical protein AB0L63_00860 [Nocardia sp. NPDC051990]|uniref:hypothetical protein n=1 Tax=Nocardia sp. NPDC051990 TaxID=3155285 RepID=UPI00342EB499
MQSSRTKIAGPVIAAGAVSLGLVLIGACGLGKHDTYVAPPPIKSANDDAAPAVRYGTSTPTAPKVIIPPSPSWQVAPPGRKPAGFTVPSSPTAVPPPASSTELEPPTTTHHAPGPSDDE